MISEIFDTRILQMYKNHRYVISALRRANITKPLPAMKTPDGAVVKNAWMVVVDDEYSDIPGFTQPLNIAEAGKAPVWVMDARMFSRTSNGDHDTIVFTARNDWMFQCVRLVLMQAMRDKEINPVRLGLLPAKAFTRWITLALAQRYNLPLETQLIISVITSLYYFQLIQGEVISNEEMPAYAQRISAITALPREQVLTRLATLGELTSIEDMCTAIKEHSENVRLKDLSFSTLYLIISTSWIGTHYRENVGVALEHAPTLLALFYTAGSEKSFRKTILSQRVESAGRPGEINDFVKQLNNITRDYFS